MLSQVWAFASTTTIDPLSERISRHEFTLPIENAFAKLKDWRHVALRVHRCPKSFLGVVTFAAIVKLWL